MGNHFNQGRIKNEEIFESKNLSEENNFIFYNSYNSKISNNKGTFDVICSHLHEGAIFQLIEFKSNQGIKRIECDLGIIGVTFKQNFTTRIIFEGLIKAIKAFSINLPNHIYVCLLKHKWNIFLRYESGEVLQNVILKIKNDYKQLGKILETFLSIENDFQYKFVDLNLNWNINEINKKFQHNNNNEGKKINSFSEENFLLKILSCENNTNIKILPKIHQSLIGFFYENFDYISDPDYSSYYLIGVNKEINDYDIYKEFEIKKDYKIKEIIRNPLEQETIIRIILLKNKEIPIDSSKISIKNKSVMIIPIPFNEKTNPEDLYRNYQVHVMINNSMVKKEQILNILENKYGEILEMNFFSPVHAVITFIDRKSAQLCLKIRNHVMITNDIDELSANFFTDITPTTISGQKLKISFLPQIYYSNLLFCDKNFEKSISAVPTRPSKPYVFRETYIPSLKGLILNKNMWDYFKIENEYCISVSVEEFVRNSMKNEIKKESNQKEVTNTINNKHSIQEVENANGNFKNKTNLKNNQPVNLNYDCYETKSQSDQVQKQVSDSLSIENITNEEILNRSNFLELSELVQMFSQSESNNVQSNSENNILSIQEDLDRSIRNPKSEKKVITLTNEILNLIPSNFCYSNEILDGMINEIKRKRVQEKSKSKNDKKRCRIQKTTDKNRMNQNIERLKKIIRNDEKKEFLNKKRKIQNLKKHSPSKINPATSIKNLIINTKQPPVRIQNTNVVKNYRYCPVKIYDEDETISISSNECDIVIELQNEDN